MYGGYGIAFDGKKEWNFGNDFARNAIIFGVDNSSSFYTDNCKNNFRRYSDINGSFGMPEEKFSINFSKARTKFCVSLHYNVDNSHFLLMEKNL